LMSKKIKETSISAAKPLLYTREFINEDYSEIFEDVKKIIILRMVKPQEVLIVIDDSGNPIRE
jgi:phosphate uptake regulator